MHPEKQQDTQLIYGKNSVLGTLNQSPDRVFKVFMADNLKPDKRLTEIIHQTKTHRIPLQTVSRSRLDQMLQSEEGTQNPIHQGIVATVLPKPVLDLYSLIRLIQDQKTTYPLLIMLDQVTDPQNVGSILRMADASGADGVILAKNRSVNLGSTVSKAASGADATVNIAQVTNLAQSLDILKEAGYWVVGTANQEEAACYTAVDYKMPIVLVMGSEGKGLSPLLQKKCDHMVKIPMAGTVSSLNVAMATAICVFEMRRQQGSSKH